MHCHRKIIEYESLADWRNKLPPANLPLVATNGCFDLIHTGHIFLLEEARARGNFLLVGITGDEALRKLKGAGRPNIPQADRAILLAALEAVSAVCIFPEVEAIHFLEKARPDLYVKGGDYTIDSINQRERRFLEGHGVKIEILPMHEKQSTSRLLRRIREGSECD